MSDDTQASTNWGEYYRKTGGRLPRELLVGTLGRFAQADQPAGYAIDLGCGAGVETLALLDRGWRVLAIDRESTAIDGVRSKAPPEQQSRLETQVAAFQEMKLPPADLIWAGLSLPFCPPEFFEETWLKIMEALRSGGRVACDLFGPRHVWAGESDMTFLSRERVVAICQSPLHLEWISEGEGEMRTAFQGMQHWHAFEVIARKV